MTSSSIAGWRRQTTRRWAALGCALLLLLGALLIDIATGPALLPISAVATALLSDGDATVSTIVWSIRLPMAFMAIAVGWALGVSGAAMQTILNNPLASCYTLGISAAAGFGAALVIVAGAALPVPEHFAIPANAALFAAIGCAAIYGIGRIGGMTSETMVLAGIALLFLFQALQSLLQYTAAPEVLQAIVFWLFGSLLKSTWPKVAVVTATLLLLMPALLRDSWKLTALRLGEERARGLGVEIGSLRVRTFFVVSALTAAAVSFVGTIGFIGLVAPHLARAVVGEDQRYLLPLSGIFGALLLAAASIASKIIHPGAVLPIGIVTALFGVPFFLVMILRHRRQFW